MNFSRAMANIVLPPAVRGTRAPVVGPSQQVHHYGVGGTMMAEWEAEPAIRQAYLANVVVYRCVQIIAETVASLPFRAGKNPDKPQAFDVNAPLARLLGPPPGGPNPDTSPSALWANAVAQLIVTGRYAWEVEWSGKTPVALWPLVSQHLKAIPAKTGRRFFSGFEYSPQGIRIPLRADQCFYDWRPSLMNWHQPESALQAARLDIAVAVMQDIYDRAFLQNDARPAGILITQAFEDEAEFESYKDRLNARYGGPANAGKTMIQEVDNADGNVTQAVQYISLGLSQKDADFFQRYQQKIKGICIALGVPLSKLDASGRTFDNASEEDKTFWRNTILPLITKMQEAINIRLAPLVGTEVGWFDLSEVEVLQPPRHILDVDPLAARDKGVLNTNEVRTMAFGLDSVPGGDEYLEAAPPPPILVPADPAAALPAVGPIQDPVPAKPKELPAKAKAKAKAIASVRDLAAERKAQRTKIWHSVDSQVSALEVTWERSLRSLFRRQSEATIARLEGKRGRQAIAAPTGTREVTPDAGAIFSADHWRRETAEHVTTLYQAVLAAAGGSLAGRFGFDMNASWVEHFINLRANRLAGLVTDTTYSSIRQALVGGVVAGEGVPDIATRIRDVFDEADRVRSVMIARTEVISAYNGSANKVGQELPDDVVAAKEWLTAPGARNPRHESYPDLDGQVVPSGDRFDVGGVAMDFPGDPNGPADDVINCRCTVALLTPAEFAERRARPGAIYRGVDEVQAALVRIAVGIAA